MSHAFSKVLLQILNMFLLNRALFQVKNLLWGLMEILFTESLVLEHNFQAIRYVCFTHGCTCFTPFQRVKQMHGFLHLFFKRLVITLLCLWVQVGSYALLFQLDFFSQRIILYPRIKSFLNLHMFYPIWLYRLSIWLLRTLRSGKTGLGVRGGTSPKITFGPSKRPKYGLP